MNGGMRPAVEKRREAAFVRTDTVEKRSSERQNLGEVGLLDRPEPENLYGNRPNVNF